MMELGISPYPMMKLGISSYLMMKLGIAILRRRMLTLETLM
jgi:hypothetical protein